MGFAGEAVINRILSDSARNNGLISKVLKLSMAHTAAELVDYTASGKEMSRLVRGLTGDQMPHEWGSIDSYDDMRACLRTTMGLLDIALEQHESESAQRRHMQDVIRDDGLSLAGVTEEMSELVFPGWDDERLNEFMWPEHDDDDRVAWTDRKEDG